MNADQTMRDRHEPQITRGACCGDCASRDRDALEYRHRLDTASDCKYYNRGLACMANANVK